MEQFNLGKYLANPKRKVVTRDGRNVRIVCTDRQGGDRPILILCFESDGIERCFSCLPNGRRYVDIDSCMDLFFAPEKKEGWANLYNLSEGPYLGSVYSSKEVAEAMSKKCGLQHYIATVKIEWEE